MLRFDKRSFFTFRLLASRVFDQRQRHDYFYWSKLHTGQTGCTGQTEIAVPANRVGSGQTEPVRRCAGQRRWSNRAHWSKYISEDNGQKTLTKDTDQKTLIKDTLVKGIGNKKMVKRRWLHN